MITMPDRSGDLIKLIEGGATAEEVQTKLRQIAQLQPLDIINFQRKFTEQAIQREEEENDRLEQFLSSL